MLRYEGRLQDGKQKPLGGVFALTFSLHGSPKGGKELWSESHFVAVDSGGYSVDLGRQRPLPAGLAWDRTFVAISVQGGAEVARERVDPKALEAAAVTAVAAVPAPVASGPPSDPGHTVVDYAENAGLALQAEVAKRADRVGKLREEDVVELLKGDGPKLDPRSTQHSEKTGGPGGRPYELVCPKGHVAIGIRGASVIAIDSLQLICAKLE